MRKELLGLLATFDHDTATIASYNPDPCLTALLRNAYLVVQVNGTLLRFRQHDVAGTKTHLFFVFLAVLCLHYSCHELKQSSAKRNRPKLSANFWNRSAHISRSSSPYWVCASSGGAGAHLPSTAHEGWGTRESVPPDITIISDMEDDEVSSMLVLWWEGITRGVGIIVWCHPALRLPDSKVAQAMHLSPVLDVIPRKQFKT